MSRLNNTNGKDSEVKTVALIGLPESGKTAFALSWAGRTFSSTYTKTAGVETTMKLLEVNAEKKFQLHLLDIGAEKGFESMLGIYLRESELVIFCVDLKSVESCIANTRSFNLGQQVSENVKFAVVFTKSDLIEEKDFPSEEKLQEYTQWVFTTAQISEEQILTRKYFVTSAKNGTGIEEAFQFWGNLWMPTIIVPQLVLPTPEKKSGPLSWFDSSLKSEDEDSEPEPLVTDFTF